MLNKKEIWFFYRENKIIGHLLEPWSDGFDNGYQTIELVEDSIITCFNQWKKGNDNLNWYYSIFKEGFLLGYYYNYFLKTNIAPLKYITFFYKLTNNISNK